MKNSKVTKTKKEHINTGNAKITTDIVIFTIEDGELKILLVKRKYEPFKGRWALPGGFIKEGETLEETARRELSEETGVSGVYLEQLYTFGEPKRDPRGRVVTAAYFALAPKHLMNLSASSDAEDAKLFSVKKHPELAFDHEKIMQKALHRLQNKIQYTNLSWSLLPNAFTLSEIQAVYELIWDKKVDKRNFRKKMLTLGLLKPLSKERTGLRQRPAKLYAFKTKTYVELRRFF